MGTYVSSKSGDIILYAQKCVLRSISRARAASACQGIMIRRQAFLGCMHPAQACPPLNGCCQLIVASSVAGHISYDLDTLLLFMLTELVSHDKSSLPLCTETCMMTCTCVTQPQSLYNPPVRTCLSRCIHYQSRCIRINSDNTLASRPASRIACLQVQYVSVISISIHIYVFAHK